MDTVGVHWWRMWWLIGGYCGGSLMDIVLAKGEYLCGLIGEKFGGSFVRDVQ